MPTKFVVALTDKGWYDALYRNPALPELREVNCWAPSAANFRALKPGDLFLIKLHHPFNCIVGGGFFVHATTLPYSFAWQVFEVANGARTEQEMGARIIKYRGVGQSDRSDFQINCRILTAPFFFGEDDWIDIPNWNRRIVKYKVYSTDEDVGLQIWEQVQERLSRSSSQVREDEQVRFGSPQIAHPRLGQGGFRVVVADNYDRRCAVTRECTLPALEASHIKPVSQGGTHGVRNGLLLRSDIHSLFDAGYVTVTPDLCFEVSPRIREEYGNGGDYYAMRGRSIAKPTIESPDPEVLRWHNDNCYRG